MLGVAYAVVDGLGTVEVEFGVKTVEVCQFDSGFEVGSGKDGSTGVGAALLKGVL